MAGLGRKTWTAGEVATAANVQGYLQDQTVMKYANTSAASSALGTAISEGMQFYLSDTDENVYYNGTGFAKQNGTTNAIINGAFDIWQRGTSFTLTNGNNALTADRWTGYGYGGTSVYSQQAFTPGSAPVSGYEGTYYIRNAAGTGARNYLEYKGEDVRTFAGQTVTLSFWAKASSAFGLEVEMYQTMGTGGSGGGTVSKPTVNITTSWVRYTQTYTMPSMAGKTIGTGSFIGFVFTSPSGTTAQTLEIWGVQLEAGSTATSFKPYNGKWGGEVQACQRYYYRWVANDAYGQVGSGNASATTQAIPLVKLPVTMRVAPTSIDYGTISTYALHDQVNAGVALTSLTLGRTNADTPLLYAVVASGLTQYRNYNLGANNSTSAYIGFSAEL